MVETQTSQLCQPKRSGDRTIKEGKWVVRDVNSVWFHCSLQISTIHGNFVTTGLMIWIA